ncbi:MAG TPA: TA system VapC family ribonuclease toxin [Burkholderiaceae bacterium]|nr:TA system VapC family ribonuclease toxin [Burkholderiaceae bacterium]
MRALLDVNVLIALLDARHTLHDRAIDWFAANGRSGWASCPISQNGCVRIMSHPSYPGAVPIRAIADRLREATTQPYHEFWADDFSLLDSDVVDAARIHGPRQMTDVYLLALAVRHAGRFVTFDSAIPVQAVRGAAPRHLVSL